MDIKPKLILNYKFGIIFSYILTVLSFFALFSLLLNICTSCINNTFSIFDIVTLIFGSLFSYFIFWKGGKFLRNSCKEQISNISDGTYINLTIIDIEETTTKEAASLGNKGQSFKLKTIYICENDIEVTRNGQNYSDVSIGDKINVLKWSDNHRTYYKYANK